MEAKKIKKRTGKVIERKKEREYEVERRGERETVKTVDD